MRGAAGRRNVRVHARDPVRWLALFALGCLVLTACASPTIQPVISAPDDPEFRDRLDMLARAFESMSTDKVLQFYAQDTYSVSFDLPYAFDPTGEDHLRTLERFFAMLRSIRLQPAASTEVWTTEDRAWTTRSYKATGTLKNGDTFQFDGWHSAIWEKRNGTWVIAYEHFGGPEAKRAFAAPPPAPAPRSTAGTATELRLRDVFFAYDRWDIRPDGVLNLLADVEMLKANPTVEVTIEGHCDERGTSEHNLQLGRKRADAVKAFLIRNGIAENRLQAVSLGKSRTFARGQGEPAWGLNRRAHLVITKR
jgi:outer membrane protein OmpA-like peptidoglycan-associated protein